MSYRLPAGGRRSAEGLAYGDQALDGGSEHEDEVVTLFLTNPDGMALESFDRAFKESGAESFC